MRPYFKITHLQIIWEYLRLIFEFPAPRTSPLGKQRHSKHPSSLGDEGRGLG